MAVRDCPRVPRDPSKLYDHAAASCRFINRYRGDKEKLTEVPVARMLKSSGAFSGEIMRFSRIRLRPRSTPCIGSYHWTNFAGESIRGVQPKARHSIRLSLSMQTARVNRIDREVLRASSRFRLAHLRNCSDQVEVGREASDTGKVSASYQGYAWQAR